MRISKESSSKTSLLFSIRKWHDSQNEMVTMLIYNAFYGVTMHVSLSLHQGVVAKRLDGSRRGASLNIGLRHRGQIPKSTFAFKIGLTTPLSMRSLSVGFDILSNSLIIFLSAAILSAVPA